MNGFFVRARLGLAVLAAGVMVGPAGQATGAQTKPDVWEPVRFMVGGWEGPADGQPGSGTARRTYTFVLKDRFLYEKNVTTYPPQPSNKAGEVHEHWSFFSYDRARKVLVLRQFHQEGFVNQYVLDTKASRPGKLVFVSEAFENLEKSWRARETYEVRSADEFVETFEVAEPGKELDVYSRTHFKRAKRAP